MTDVNAYVLEIQKLNKAILRKNKAIKTLRDKLEDRNVELIEADRLIDNLTTHINFK
jgi:hypothetical protein